MLGHTTMSGLRMPIVRSPSRAPVIVLYLITGSVIGVNDNYISKQQKSAMILNTRIGLVVWHIAPRVSHRCPGRS